MQAEATRQHIKKSVSKTPVSGACLFLLWIRPISQSWTTCWYVDEHIKFMRYGLFSRSESRGAGGQNRVTGCGVNISQVKQHKPFWCIGTDWVLNLIYQVYTASCDMASFGSPCDIWGPGAVPTASFLVIPLAAKHRIFIAHASWHLKAIWPLLKSSQYHYFTFHLLEEPQLLWVFAQKELMKVQAVRVSQWFIALTFCRHRPEAISHS